MRNSRLIARVRSMLERANTLEEGIRLSNLLLMLQKDYIHDLEKLLAPINNRKVG